MLFLSASLGLGLEGLHAWKVSWYLAPGSETRRLVWTLAHAHGVLLGLLNLAFANALERAWIAPARRASASGSLLAATVLMPLGFFLGGVVVHGGDPGVGIVLVPPGGLLVLVALGLIAW